MPGFETLGQMKEAGGMANMSMFEGILGKEEMPSMSLTDLGKVRLLMSLRRKFGIGFKNQPGVQKALQEFDKDLEIAKLARKRQGRS